LPAPKAETPGAQERARMTKRRMRRVGLGMRGDVGVKGRVGPGQSAAEALAAVCSRLYRCTARTVLPRVSELVR
jgi:hypothetical protein